ncbi:MAG: type II toxin-antitoxin system RelE/ParE family toxin [Steroidobacteraceae bacterium]
MTHGGNPSANEQHRARRRSAPSRPRWIDGSVQDELRAHAKLLEQFGPSLGRPTLDTLKGARHPNLKELRFDAANGVWRVAFAFDPRRHGVLLATGDKSGTSEKRFYRELVETADKRLDAGLDRLKDTERKTNEPRRKK